MQSNLDALQDSLLCQKFKVEKMCVAVLNSDNKRQTYYCKHNDQVLQLFASSLFFAGAVSSIPGAVTASSFGWTACFPAAIFSIVIFEKLLVEASHGPSWEC